MQGRSQYAHNGLLKGVADHGILITRDRVPKDRTAPFPQLVPEWLELFEELKVPPSLRVHTLWGERNPEVDLPEDTIIIRDMDRSLVPFHPQIQKLALRVLELADES